MRCFLERSAVISGHLRVPADIESEISHFVRLKCIIDVRLRKVHRHEWKCRPCKDSI